MAPEDHGFSQHTGRHQEYFERHESENCGKGGWWAPPEATGAITSLSGEAVVLEVAPGKYLFALLRGTPHAYEVFFPKEAPLEIASKLSDSRETRELKSSQYPTLVTFGDIKDPASVRRVDPMRLDAAFGAGYRLNSITLSITDDPPTDGKLSTVLDWLGRLPEPALLPEIDPYDFSFAAKLRHGDFLRKK
jgi:hypothetical protein